ncbi:hypothetical protein HOR19_gp06 [Phage MedPE-SWcel-C56]|uniref:Uncharacterized protein n=1 Tax=Phage MedPE-SWcel-C56 TaxID=1871314 RepID=A0A1B1IXY8_9CAUD|nr:hypothetical protein HOR19_gp06 [Phage MedPE-SWcel-C56]ANS06199.1 hypothetical protein [Phage MedPE-SWcel-C56]
MSEHALFVSRDKAARSAERLRFIMLEASWFEVHKRQALVGYGVRFKTADGWSRVTEKDVVKYGL